MDSIDPKTYLTFGPWIYLVPQYKPESILILGYGEGTVSGLIEMFYGDVLTVGVDKKEINNLYGGSSLAFVKKDARDFLRDCPFNFDCIVVDLWEDYEPCPFIFEKEFIDLLVPRCENYLIIHADDRSNMFEYEKFRKLRTLELTSHRFHYFIIGDVSKLPVR